MKPFGFLQLSVRFSVRSCVASILILGVPSAFSMTQTEKTEALVKDLEMARILMATGYCPENVRSGIRRTNTLQGDGLSGDFLKYSPLVSMGEMTLQKAQALRNWINVYTVESVRGQSSGERCRKLGVPMLENAYQRLLAHLSGQNVSVPTPAESCTVVVADESGSMSDQMTSQFYSKKVSKVRIVQEQVAAGISSRSFPNGEQLSMLTFGGEDAGGGGSSGSSCNNVRQLIAGATGPRGRNSLVTQLRSLKPYGATPMAFGMANGLRSIGHCKKMKVVLISDGDETCAGDACEMMQALNASGLSVELKIAYLGDSRADSKLHKRLDCMVKNSVNGELGSGDAIGKFLSRPRGGGDKATAAGLDSMDTGIEMHGRKTSIAWSVKNAVKNITEKIKMNNEGQIETADSAAHVPISPESLEANLPEAKQSVAAEMLPEGRTAASNSASEPQVREASAKAPSSLAEFEDKFFRHTYPNESEEARMGRLEKMMFGQESTGPVDGRLKKLIQAHGGSGDYVETKNALPQVADQTPAIPISDPVVANAESEDLGGLSSLSEAPAAETASHSLAHTGDSLVGASESVPLVSQAPVAALEELKPNTSASPVVSTPGAQSSPAIYSVGKKKFSESDFRRQVQSALVAGLYKGYLDPKSKTGACTVVVRRGTQVFGQAVPMTDISVWKDADIKRDAKGNQVLNGEFVNFSMGQPGNFALSGFASTAGALKANPNVPVTVLGGESSFQPGSHLKLSGMQPYLRFAGESQANRSRIVTSDYRLTRPIGGETGLKLSKRIFSMDATLNASNKLDSITLAAETSEFTSGELSQSDASAWRSHRAPKPGSVTPQQKCSGLKYLGPITGDLPASRNDSSSGNNEVKSHAN